jgi:hypothetical protein
LLHQVGEYATESHNHHRADLRAVQCREHQFEAGRGLALDHHAAVVLVGDRPDLGGQLRLCAPVDEPASTAEEPPAKGGVLCRVQLEGHVVEGSTSRERLRNILQFRDRLCCEVNHRSS